MIALYDLTAFPETDWKNGQGRTRELARGDTQGGTWRVSLASIEGDGPFSSFPGFMRHLALASPGHLTLSTAADDGPHHLDRAGVILSFDGHMAVRSACPSGPVMAFNLMASHGQPALLFAHETPFTLPHTVHFTLLPLRGPWHVTGRGPAFGPGNVLQGKMAAGDRPLSISPMASSGPQAPLCLAALIPPS
ncbi:HutD family protein [Asaia siamensis]